MALRGDYLVLKVQQYSSGTNEAIIAESTSVTVDFSSEFLETTSQSSGLFTSGIQGKVTGTVSGDFLVASTYSNWTRLITKQWAGEVISVKVYFDGGTTDVIDCDGVITSISASGGNSDQLTTGSYSITLSGDPNT